MNPSPSLPIPIDTAPTVLLCTLGATWAVIPEVLGWLAPDVVDLYAHHPERARLDALRAQHSLRRPTEVWVVTTEGRQTQQSLKRLMQWRQTIEVDFPLRIWTAAGTDQLATQAECDHIRELTLRATLRAAEHCGPQGQLILSLAGGRKTMSADLQTAGQWLGAAACLHVVGPEPLPVELTGRQPPHDDALPALLSVPLPPHLAANVMPLIATAGARSELLDVPLDGHTVSAARFPLPDAPPNGTLQPWQPDGRSLHADMARRQQASSQLLGNFLAQLAQTERHENWRSLYRLPPATIQQLRQTPLTAAHLPWLQNLPKADLHRHLGGCLSLEQQRTVAHAIWQEVSKENRLKRLSELREQLSIADSAWPWNWPAQLSAVTGPDAGQTRAERSAALLLHASPEQLQRNLYGTSQPRCALKTRHPQGFAAYERPGELSGSALLCHPAALAAYAQAVVSQARAEGLAYVELRGSPHKYRPQQPGQFLADFRHALQQAGAQVGPDAPTPTVGQPPAPRIGFIWILDRRQRHTLPTVVTQAVAAHREQGGFLLGLDLAGDEGTHNPADLAPGFMPAFEACLPITIHAGEGEAPENIWQAAYHLHADRVGHGLTLIQRPELAARFRDRGIALELCPSSNREVVGFADPAHPASAGLPAYPLRAFIDAGLPLTLCTDNPGISQTTLAHEYLAAARMTEGGLTQWEALALMRQAFVHAFLPSAQRETLLKRCDQLVFGHASAITASHTTP